MEVPVTIDQIASALVYLLCAFAVFLVGKWTYDKLHPRFVLSEELLVRDNLALALAIVFVMNPFWIRTAALIGNIALPMEIPATDWRAAREALAAWTERADMMIMTEELGAIYFLGRSDVRFSPSKLGELRRDQQHEFGIDHRTGRPVISTPESVEQLIECFPQGFVVGPIEHWGNPILISDEIQTILRRHAEPIQVPERSYLYAWGWKRESTSTQPAYCLNLMRFSGRQPR